jgi:hypothetical protein
MPDGSQDVNVFDIQQGVAISTFIKSKKNIVKQLGVVHNYDLYGKRETKYSFLMSNSIKTILFQKTQNIDPNYYFVKRDFAKQAVYNKGFSINDLFIINGVGLTTAHDEFVILENKEQLHKRFLEFQNSERDREVLHSKFNVKKK